MPYADIHYGSAAADLLRLATQRPDLASLSTTQALFGLPTAGQCRDASNKMSACQNYVLEVTNRTSLASDPERPEVLISGALHGDERVGPATAMALSRWLIERYDADPWIRRLVDTRIVLIMPMTNAIGVELRRRDELNFDPNRDFPYDQTPSRCMLTIAARSLNELYRAHLLQLVITFHGGMQAIAYNWGSFNYYSGKPHRSPDDTSQRGIAEQMSRFAGTGNVAGQRLYPTSTMNDLVYPVHGGMEDWGYAASWDKAFVKACTPNSYGGYPAAKTASYPDGAVRSYTVLVETSDSKSPPPHTYGSEEGVYAPGKGGDGHVPRNVRLALAGIDLVRPWIEARLPFPQKGTSTTSTSSLSATTSSSRAASAPRVVARGECVPLEWVAWGAIHVEASSPVCRKPGQDTWASCGVSQSGDGVWGAHSSPLSPHTFSGCATIPADAPEGSAFLIAVQAKVDSDWGRAPGAAHAPSVGPQTHIARARAEGTASSNSKHTTSGHVTWQSEPIQVTIASSGAAPPSPSPPSLPPPIPSPPPAKPPMVPCHKRPCHTCPCAWP